MNSARFRTLLLLSLFLVSGCDLTESSGGGGGGNLQFDVEGNQAFVSGDLGTNSPARVRKFLDENPEVTVLVLEDIPGSSDDEANLAAARMVRAAGLDTVVPSYGEIYSGGVDFFLAGVRRTAEPGAVLGVHSWSDGEIQGRDLPRDHPDHQVYLPYFPEMGIPVEFFWFTLDAAPAEGMYIMTPADMRRYRVVNN